jgi:hypothetical protein
MATPHRVSRRQIPPCYRPKVPKNTVEKPGQRAGSFPEARKPGAGVTAFFLNVSFPAYWTRTARQLVGTGSVVTG